MLSSDFLNLFGSKTKFLGGQTPAFPLCGRPWLQIHLCFFSHSIKMRGLPLSPANHCLAALPATMSAFNSSAATGFSTKSLDSQKNSLHLKQIH